MTLEWHPIKLAPDGELIMTKIDDKDGTRNEQMLIRRGRLWFVPGEKMYVYYAPTHWAWPEGRAALASHTRTGDAPAQRKDA